LQARFVFWSILRRQVSCSEFRVYAASFSAPP